MVSFGDDCTIGWCENNNAQANTPRVRQLFNFIPSRLVSDLAADQDDAPKARTYSYWSQVVALIHAQLMHAMRLNDVCDALRLHSESLSAIRGATPPSRNNLSHANKHRQAIIAEQLFRCRWQIEVLLLRAASRRSPPLEQPAAGWLAPLGSNRSRKHGGYVSCIIRQSILKPRRH